MKTIIIGGVAGGASAAARLRRLNESMEIVMIERGEYISFANCGLPYYIGDVITRKEHLIVQTPESFDARFAIDIRTFSQAIAIDPKAKKITIQQLKTGQTYTESYDYLILSPGAEPIRPALGCEHSEKIFTLRNIPDTYKIKDYLMQHHCRSAVVIGGGYIGMEMVENLHQAGVSVTVVERANHVIGSLDYDMACEVHNHLKNKGVHLRLSQQVTGLEEVGDQIKVLLSQDHIITDLVIMAVGVAPESHLAKEANLKVTAQGCIVVDTHLRTSDSAIYALGDAIEVQHFVSGEKTYIPLAGPANKQGRIVADHICGLDSAYCGTQGTAVLKCFDLTIATTGLNESAVQRAGYQYEKSYTYSASHATYYPNASMMGIKLIFTKDSGKILGAQVIGMTGVDKRCDVLATAIRAGMTVYDLTQLELCYAPPYSSAKDPVNMAGFVAENILTQKVDIFHWDEVASVDPAQATLLDVMTPKEHSRGTIPGTINIPVDSLRDRLNELDKNKTIYVNCMIGLRGYVACRILMQHGFTCKNLSGGYKLYRSIEQNQ